MINSNISQNLKLNSNELEDLSQRLSLLTDLEPQISETAYKGIISSGPCGCKGSCEGGCTSW